MSLSTSCVASSGVAAPPKRRQNHRCPQRQPPSRSCASVGRVQPVAPEGSPHPRSAPLSTKRIAASAAATNCAATLAASRQTRQSAPSSDTQGQRERETKRESENVWSICLRLTECEWGRETQSRRGKAGMREQHKRVYNEKKPIPIPISKSAQNSGICVIDWVLSIN